MGPSDLEDEDLIAEKVFKLLAGIDPADPNSMTRANVSLGVNTTADSKSVLDPNFAYIGQVLAAKPDIIVDCSKVCGNLRTPYAWGITAACCMIEAVKLLYYSVKFSASAAACSNRSPGASHEHHCC